MKELGLVEIDPWISNQTRYQLRYMVWHIQGVNN